VTPNELSDIHTAAFTDARPWSPREFEQLLSNPHTHLFTQEYGFALVQLIAGEAELLTIAVHPKAQGQGQGHHLMRKWMHAVSPADMFLEVAQDNTAARHLYQTHGFAEVARRKSYYARKSGVSVDAIVMRMPST
jgi:ribosomal-protein-alanine N-acetyltransferase